MADDRPIGEPQAAAWLAGMTAATLWILSNGVGAVAFALLSGYLAYRNASGASNRLLLIACVVNGLWCALFALAPIVSFSGPVLDLSETVRDGAWLAVVASLLPHDRTGPAISVMRFAAITLPCIFFLVIFAHVLGAPAVHAVMPRSWLFAVGAVLMSLLGLVLLEQIYRSADMGNRWQVKYLCLAVAVFFAYDFLMYSYVLLNPRIDIAVWNARGAVNAMMVPLIAVAVTRQPGSGARLQLSHRAAFHSTAIILSGLYLLVIGLAGLYIRNFGGTWGEVFGVLFVVAMIVIFLVLLSSGRIRSIYKVLIRKHFFQYKYDYRDEWLDLTRQLSRAEEIADPYQRSISAVAQILDSPSGALWLWRENIFTCVAEWNMSAATDTTETGRSEFVEFLRDRGWIVDLQEYADDPAHYGHVRLPGWLSEIPRAHLVIPLFVERSLLGFMLLSAPRAATTLGWEDLDLLKTVGRQVGSFLGEQENHQALAQARQFEAFNRLTAFLMHDLKNIAQQQSLIVQNARKHRHNPAFIDDMILTVDSSVQRMKRLLDQLQRTTADNKQARRVPVADLVERVIGELSGRGRPLIYEAETATALIYADPERFAMVLQHVIRNAQEASPDDADVWVRVSETAGQVRIAVTDQGGGMSPTFVRESLFRPFYSTKSSRGMGIGAYQTREFARAAGGDVEVVSEPGKGTTFTIVLPTADSAEQGKPGQAKTVEA